jgi:hypothetical protein
MTQYPDDMSMLQRVARVLAGANPNEWTRHIDMARAVLLAMRGPTASMIEAAHPGLPFADDLADDWDAMLTHAASDLQTVPMLEPGFAQRRMLGSL